MELIPAIDLLDGKVVRLHQGRYDDVTSYGDDPVDVARRFHAAGAKRLHIVDLEGARTGHPAHVDVIARILSEVPLAVQVGGGIRSRQTFAQWLSAGAQRVVVGTLAVKEPALVEDMCRQHPETVIVALDARGEEVAVEGWTEASGHQIGAMATLADDWGAAGILYTDIDRDGTGEGPAVTRTSELQGQVSCTVIASGGIGALEHLEALRKAGVREAVCGRALYEGAFSLEAAIQTSLGVPDAR